jgi:hypothetical protein
MALLFYRRPPSPPQPEALSMTADYGVRLDQDKSRAPIGVQLGQENPKEAVAATQQWSWPMSAQHGQLLTQGQVLQNKLTAWQQKQTQETADRVKQFHAVTRTGRAIARRQQRWGRRSIFASSAGQWKAKRGPLGLRKGREVKMVGR